MARERLVFLLDHRPERARALAALLEKHYRIEPKPAASWKEYGSVSLPHVGASGELAILADDLPPNDLPLFKRLDSLFFSLQFTVFGALVLTCGAAIDLEPYRRQGFQRVSSVCVPGPELNEAAVAAVLGELRTYLGAPASLPNLTPVRGSDPVLDEQIRSLAPHDPEQAHHYLRLFIQDMWRCQSAHIERLSQGYSGDLVLRVRPLDGEGSGRSFALKISRRSRLRSREHEVSSWPKIQEALILGENYKRHVPELWPTADDKREHLVQTKEHCAVAYQFLGTDRHHFIDLEKAYLGPAQAFADLCDARYCKSGLLAETMVGEVVSCLRGAWYDAAAVVAHRFWGGGEPGEAGGAEGPGSALYGLGPESQARLLVSLEWLDHLGRRPPLYGRGEGGWRDDRQAITQWINGGPGAAGPFGRPWRVVVSGVHGDLNKTNILLWREGKQPFLIDFATYQEQGHTLQDLARLEVEILFLLMDRESESGLPAFDLTPGQLPLWQGVAGRLAELSAPAAESAKGKNSRGVRRAARLVESIRCQAREVHAGAHRKAPGPDACPFELEYAVPLLYHTLRVIGYEGVSPFKRLLAVHSAARLLEFVNRLGR